MTYDEMKRAADIIALCEHVPVAYKGNPKNVLIALNTALEWNLDPFMVRQELPKIDTEPNLDADEAAFCDGYLARARGLQLGSNPYTPMTDESISWAQGWIDADGDSIQDDC